jgi:hypothetical protein
MAQAFKLAQADVLIQAEYIAPAFGLFQDPSKLLESLHADLNRFGLRVADMSFQGEGTNYAGEHIVCAVLSRATNVVVRTERAEVNCWDLFRVTQDAFVDLVVTSLETVTQFADSYKTCNVGLNLHGVVEGTPTREYLARFSAGPPDGLGPSMGSGTVFYYGAEAERLLSAISIDLSGTQPDAVFLRLQSVWDVTKISLRDVSPLAQRYYVQMLQAIGLEWPSFDKNGR